MLRQYIIRGKNASFCTAWPFLTICIKIAKKWAN